MKKTIFLIIALSALFGLESFGNAYEPIADSWVIKNHYLQERCIKATKDEPHTDSLLNQRLEWFQDMKFGLFIHFGIYSQ